MQTYRLAGTAAEVKVQQLIYQISAYPLKSINLAM